VCSPWCPCLSRTYAARRSSLPAPMIAPPPGVPMKLPGFPRRALLAPPQTCEILDFRKSPDQLCEDQQYDLEFLLSSDSELCGLMIHIEVAFPVGKSTSALTTQPAPGAGPSQEVREASLPTPQDAASNAPSACDSSCGLAVRPIAAGLSSGRRRITPDLARRATLVSPARASSRGAAA